MAIVETCYRESAGQRIINPEFRHERTARARRQRVRTIAGIVLSVVGLAACDHRPINATAALPAPGTLLSAFTFPEHRGSDSVRSSDLQGGATVLALWSTHCPYQGPWVAAFDSLVRTYAGRGIRFIVLANDAPGRVLDSVLSRAPWPPGVEKVGVASGRLSRLFDRSRSAPERATDRVAFVLPSFLLVGPRGYVIRRGFGPVLHAFSPALDSLLATTGAATTSALDPVNLARERSHVPSHGPQNSSRHPRSSSRFL